MHKAVSDAVSLHVTIGVHWVTTFDLVEAVVRRAGQVVPEMEHGLPHRWFEPGVGQEEAIARLRSALPGLVGDDEVAAVLDSLYHDLVATRQPLVPGQLDQLLRVDEIGPDTRVARRAPMMWRWAENEDTVELSCFGSVIAFPIAVRAALAVILDGDDVRVGDLPGLDDTERLVLVRRLVREGVARACW